MAQQTTQEKNRIYDLCNDIIREEVKNFYYKTFTDVPLSYNNAKTNLNEKICFSPNCKCTHSRVIKYKRIKINYQSICIVVNVEPPKLYVFCRACASFLCKNI